MSYAILSDPQRRAAYDKGGASAIDLEEAMANMSVDDMGPLGGIVGGMFGVLGVDMPTAVSHKVIDEALDGAAGAPILTLGEEVSGAISKGTADFYRIRVSEEASAGGIAIRAWTGVKGDRIKLLLFDSHGELRWQADGLPQKIMGVKGPLEGVVATMPFAENEMLVLGKPAPDIMLEVSLLSLIIHQCAPLSLPLPYLALPLVLAIVLPWYLLTDRIQIKPCSGDSTPWNALPSSGSGRGIISSLLMLIISCPSQSTS